MQSNIAQLRDTLRATPDAEEALLVLFKQNNWIAITAKATAHELIEHALNQIRYDATKYFVFIDMLNEMVGMDLIVILIEGKAKLNTSHST